MPRRHAPRQEAAADEQPPTLREMSATVAKLLDELRRAAEHDLLSRAAETPERDRVAAELEALRAEQEALLGRLKRLESLAAQAPAADGGQGGEAVGLGEQG